MRSDVHFAALRAAAKVAFSVALLNGCSSADVQGDGEQGEGDDSASSESAILSNDTGDAGSTTAPKKPCHDKEAGAAKSCEAILASAFPDAGHYQWQPVAQSTEVVACCDKELTDHGPGTAYRWECCVAYDPTADAGQNGLRSVNGHGMACTPWGPPVPPSMKRIARRRPNPEIAAWIAKAVA